MPSSSFQQKKSFARFKVVPIHCMGHFQFCFASLIAHGVSTRGTSSLVVKDKKWTPQDGHEHQDFLCAFQYSFIAMESFLLHSSSRDISTIIIFCRPSGCDTNRSSIARRDARSARNNWNARNPVRG